ncbi:HEAT repeat domain-containing protein [Geitlerinema sp. PCC 9228]|jgi:HEAT repeat protein|uniref:HEAT repeat domain-containing protein n=1 Tax=Geitlerinema sp. PCC 9228 TaxID=111611 RepID=UPI0008F9BC88|nr:HEAT repeat domain-containing protein [Geitlerinema sp. PCC 9228]
MVAANHLDRKTAWHRLQSGDFQQRWEAAKWFCRQGKDIVWPCIDLANDENADWETRWFAIWILGQLDNPEVAIALTRLTQNSDEDLAQHAAHALSSYRSEARIVAMQDLLQQPGTKFLATQTLATIRHTATIPLLLSVVDDEMPEIRAMALEALSSFNDSRLPPIFQRLLADSHAKVRQAAISGIAASHTRQQIDDATTVLMPLLQDEHPTVASHAAKALEKIASPQAADALVNRLRNSTLPASLQIDIARALAAIETETAVTGLGDYLQNAASIPVCREIAHLLGRLRNECQKDRATQYLLAFLQQQSEPSCQPQVQQAVAMALGKLGRSTARTTLEQMTDAAVPAVAFHARYAWENLPR